jgi:hypothetical protein
VGFGDDIGVCRSRETEHHHAGSPSHRKERPVSRATQLATNVWSSVEGALILSRVLRSPEPFDLAIALLAATAENEANASIDDTRQGTVS